MNTNEERKLTQVGVFIKGTNICCAYDVVALDASCARQYLEQAFPKYEIMVHEIPIVDNCPIHPVYIREFIARATRIMADLLATIPNAKEKYYVPPTNTTYL